MASSALSCGKDLFRFKAHPLKGTYGWNESKGEGVGYTASS